jgi:outer membrane receptor protein involved in Fe transport
VSQAGRDRARTIPEPEDRPGEASDAPSAGKELGIRSRPLTSCALAALLTALAARADDRLDEVVVTAPPVHAETPAPADVTGFATVIDTRDAPAGVATLAETLSAAPGVQVRRFGGLGEFSTVSVRGFSPGQVQVYLDGVPLSRADDEVVNLGDLPLDALERIDVYRGVTPLAFAQSGPGGVVNLIPRRPGLEPLNAASVSYGSFVTRKLDVARSASEGPWEYLAFGQYLGSRNDFTFTNDLGTTDNPNDDRTETRQNAAFDQGGFTARVGWRPAGPLSVWFTSDSFGKEQGVPGRGSVQSTAAHRRVVRQLAQLTGRLASVGSLPLTAEGSAYLVYQGERFEAPLGDPAFIPTDVTERTLGGGGQLLVRGALGRHHVPGLLVGLGHEALREDNAIGVFPVLEPGESPTRTRLRATVAAEDEVLLLGERVSLVPSGRVEVYRDDFPPDLRQPPAFRTSGVEVQAPVSGRFGVRAEVVRGLTLLGNVSRSVRVPNLQELFGNSGTVRGNPDLKPETARSWDLGFRWTLPPFGPLAGASFEYGHFDSHVDDLIVLQPTSVSVFTPTNLARTRVRGNEIALQGSLWERIGVTANVTQQDTENDDPRYDEPKQIPGLPALEAYLRLDLSWNHERPLPLGALGTRLWPGRVFVEANLIADNFLDAANTVRVPSRSLWNIGVAVEPPLGALQVGIEIRNLTDDETRDLLDFPLPGRAVFATVSWGFGRANLTGDSAAR